MKAQVRFVSTNDGEDLEGVVLEDPDDVDVWITVMPSPVDGPAQESFQLRVRSPLSSTRELNQWGLLHERRMVGVARWDPHQIRSFINRLFTEAEGRDWKEVGEKLSRLGYWEFEDYKP